MTEYRIVYTINGQGYTKTDPWIFDATKDRSEVRALLDEAHEYLAKHGTYEIWVTAREISEWTWTRVDNEFFV